MKSANVTVGTTAVQVIAADNKFREVYLHNAGGGKVYLGDETVTSSTGFHLGNGEAFTLQLPLGENLYAISASGTNAVITLTPDGD